MAYRYWSICFATYSVQTKNRTINTISENQEFSERYYSWNKDDQGYQTSYIVHIL